MSSGGHRLGVTTQTRSLAVWRWWKLRWPVKSYIEQEGFMIRFKFKNLASQNFPGGTALMEMTWPPLAEVRWPLTVPKLEPNQEAYAIFPHGREETKSYIVSGILSFIFCRVLSSNDNQNIDLTNFEGSSTHIVGPGGNSIAAIPATTWSGHYTKYSLIISAAGLFIVALGTVASFIRWLWLLITPDP